MVGVYVTYVANVDKGQWHLVALGCGHTAELLSLEMNVIYEWLDPVGSLGSEGLHPLHPGSHLTLSSFPPFVSLHMNRVSCWSASMFVLMQEHKAVFVSAGFSGSSSSRAPVVTDWTHSVTFLLLSDCQRLKTHFLYVWFVQSVDVSKFTGSSRALLSVIQCYSWNLLLLQRLFRLLA